MTREEKIYIAIWKKALAQSPEPLTINLHTYSQAISLRMGMYRAIRPFRESGSDPVLTEAALRLVPTIEAKSSTIIIREKNSPAEFAFDLLGFREEDLIDADEIAMAEKLKLLLKPDVSDETPSNPFFTRGG